MFTLLLLTFVVVSFQVPSNVRLHTSPPRDFSHSQPESEHNYAILEAKASTADTRHMRRIDSCGSLDSHSHRYFGEDQRYPVDSTAHAQFRQVAPVTGNVDHGGYEVLNRNRSGSAGSHSIRSGERNKSQSPPRNTSPRNPSPLRMESSSTAAPPVTSTSPDYLVQQDYQALSASDCQFRPISVNESRIRPRTSSGDRFPSKPPMGMVRPSSTTPGSRHRINSRGSGGEQYEPKIMSPLSPSRKVPQSFKMLASEINKLPSRCDPQLDYVLSRSESLV